MDVVVAIVDDVPGVASVGVGVVVSIYVSVVGVVVGGVVVVDVAVVDVVVVVVMMVDVSCRCC